MRPRRTDGRGLWSQIGSTLAAPRVAALLGRPAKTARLSACGHPLRSLRVAEPGQPLRALSALDSRKCCRWASQQETTRTAPCPDRAWYRPCRWLRPCRWHWSCRWRGLCCQRGPCRWHRPWPCRGHRPCALAATVPLFPAVTFVANVLLRRIQQHTPSMWGAVRTSCIRTGGASWKRTSAASRRTCARTSARGRSRAHGRASFST